MRRFTIKRDGYSRAERLSDAAVHVVGVIWALISVSVLITLVIVWHSDAGLLAATAVYSACLILMLTASAVYHMSPRDDWRSWLRRLDQSAIYVKIAGTYTPFAFLSGTSMGAFLAGIWTAALAGTSLRLIAPDRYLAAALALYIGMGWAGVILGGDLIASLSPAAVKLMLTGGAIYTLGVVFFLWEALPFHNTIWHVFVLVATVIFYAAVVVEVSAYARV